MKNALVCGAGGFIGNHLVRYLKSRNYWVRGASLKYPEYGKTAADEFVIGDLRDENFCRKALNKSFNEVYQLAADMGGAGYLFTGKHDADVMYNSTLINLNILNLTKNLKKGKIFYSSSACVYKNPKCSEDSAYPAAPMSEYGWEKLFSERMYLAYQRNYGLQVRIARFHTIIGPEQPWNNGKEKAPLAICRKVAEAPDGGEIEIWGDGKQTRSFLYIDECLEGVRRLMDSDFTGPVNIGSEEMVSINQLAKMVMEIAGKKLTLKHISGPLGVRGRNSDNRLIEQKLGWAPDYPLRKGLEITYRWVEKQVQNVKKSK